MDEEGYPTYRRRDNGRSVEKKGTSLDSRYVVPCNPTLLKLFQGHLNVEKTNQSRAIKYLFKYISKGNDRVVAGIYDNNVSTGDPNAFDEITHYLNCRYVSPCEGAWRIFTFDIHHRYPTVERFSFHLPEQQAVYYSRKDGMPTLLKKPRVKESMFLAWMDMNVDNVSATDHDNMAFQELYTTEFLNTINCSGLPPHRLCLKVGVPIMLMQNIDQSAGLVNGTRLRVTFLGKHFLKAVALNGTSTDQKFLIHRMDMNPSECKLPFTMTRRQFPIILSFAMTINKSQGQSMSNVGLYLPSPVFTHGQLYVALSRVKRIDDLKILILSQDNLPTDVTTNVVYRKIFHNIEP